MEGYKSAHKGFVSTVPRLDKLGTNGGNSGPLLAPGSVQQTDPVIVAAVEESQQDV